MDQLINGSVGQWVSWSWVMDHGSMGHVSWVSGSVGRWVSGSWVTVLLTQYYTTDTITLCNAMLIIIDTYWSYRLTVVQRDGFLDLCYIDFKTACLLSALSNQSPLCRNTCRFDWVFVCNNNCYGSQTVGHHGSQFRWVSGSWVTPLVLLCPTRIWYSRY